MVVEAGRAGEPGGAWPPATACPGYRVWVLASGARCWAHVTLGPGTEFTSSGQRGGERARRVQPLMPWVGAQDLSPWAQPHCPRLFLSRSECFMQGTVPRPTPGDADLPPAMAPRVPGVLSLPAHAESLTFHGTPERAGPPAPW